MDRVLSGAIGGWRADGHWRREGTEVPVRFYNNQRASTHLGMRQLCGQLAHVLLGPLQLGLCLQACLLQAANPANNQGQALTAACEQPLRLCWELERQRYEPLLLQVGTAA